MHIPGLMVEKETKLAPERKDAVRPPRLSASYKDPTNTATRFGRIGGKKKIIRLLDTKQNQLSSQNTFITFSPSKYDKNMVIKNRSESYSIS